MGTGGLKLGFRVDGNWYVEFEGLPAGLADAQPHDLAKCWLGSTDEMLAMTPALLGFVIGERYAYLCRVLRESGGMPYVMDCLLRA